jgi:hypothetical protein
VGGVEGDRGFWLAERTMMPFSETGHALRTRLGRKHKNQVHPVKAKGKWRGALYRAFPPPPVSVHLWKEMPAFSLKFWSYGCSILLKN